MTNDAEVEANLARARAGDEGAFEALTEPHRRELQVHCYRILGSLQDAEDLVQETLLAAWRGLERFEGRASLRAWLYRIATNRCLNMLRDRGRRPQEVPPMASARADPPHGAALARAVSRCPARGRRGGLNGGARATLRAARVGRAGVRHGASAAAAAPAGGARATRRARLQERRGRGHARHGRHRGEGRPPAGPGEGPHAGGARATASARRLRTRHASASWSGASPMPSRAATSTRWSRC